MPWRVLLLISLCAAQVLWQQHLDTSVYNDVGISRLGYVVAGTWLNEPEVAEIFDLETGNKTIKSIGDPNPYDNADYTIDISELSSVAVAARVSDGNFTSFLYKWDCASPKSDPDWSTPLLNTQVFDMDVSGDGSLIAVATYANLSYYRPPTFQALFLDGASGQEKIEHRWTGTEGEEGAGIVTSDDGSYAAFITAIGQAVSLTVLHLPSKQNHSQPVTDFVIGHAYAQAFAMSGDGRYVAAGQAGSFTVWKRDDSKPALTYTVLFSFSTPVNTFYVESNSISFAAAADVIAVGWIDIRIAAGRNRVTVFQLPSSKPVLDWTGPAGTGQYQNIVTGVRVSESGKYVALSSWGNQNPNPGTQQVQVFSILNTTAPVYSLFTPGSMFSVGLTETVKYGPIVVAAGKHVHANVMGNGGDLFVAKVDSSYVAPTGLNQPVVDLAAIAAINSARPGWQAGINRRFVDWTLSKAQGLMGTRLRGSHVQPQHSNVEVGAIPSSFDARVAFPGCVGEIRDQQQCGSCWAFGAVEAFSDRLCIAQKKRTFVDLSPEYVLDCDTKDGACGGGWLAYAWEFLTLVGTVPDSCVPYVAGHGQAGRCSKTCTSPNGTWHRFTVKQNSTVELQGEVAMQQAIMAAGPIEAAFTVFSDFMNYQSGVYSHTTGIFMGGHAIKILGWGSSGGVDYWIAANSWGATWGMSGFFYIRRGTDECYIESNAIAGLPNV